MLMQDRELRVLTHNIYGKRADWPARAAKLRDGLTELGPDVIALQETVVHAGDDQTRDFLPDGYEVAHSRERDPDGQGISIASRWPMRVLRELDLRVTERCEGFSCTALLAEIEGPPAIGRFLFVNHFPQWQLDHEHERELQAVVLARAVEAMLRRDPMHVILAGDLDAAPDAASIRFFAGKQSLDGLSVCYRSAWESIHGPGGGETFTTENPLMRETNWDWPFQRIDHIMIRCGHHGGPTLRILDCRRAFDAAVDGVWASDHFGVLCDLAPPRPDADIAQASSGA
ncbi:endonuclease/exonuclease/phosphatase family protein [Neorhizobium sp. DT-125]|uniref:endonuclease/exonuclease/phosphatase family protein n=1 Tax=Neorhizobium sp. DT-125 TaxID=3396163 RepID=UPI003F1AD800